MTKLSDQLISSRKHMKPPATYPKVESYKTLKQIGSFPLHDSTKPGILDLDIHPLNDNYILSGGRDSRAILFDRKEGKKLFAINPFDSKKQPAVTLTKFVPGQQDVYALLGSADG